MLELSFISIMSIVILVWFLWSQIKKSKTVNVVADSIQDMVELGSNWAHSSMVDTATIGNMDRSKALMEKHKEITGLNITKDKINTINSDWGIGSPIPVVAKQED